MNSPLHLNTEQWPELWQATCRTLEDSIVSTQIDAWIQPLELVLIEQIDQGIKAHLLAPNDFSAQWVRDHFQKTIEEAFAQVSGYTCSLHLSVDLEASAKNKGLTPGGGEGVLEEPSSSSLSSSTRGKRSASTSPFSPTREQGILHPPATKTRPDNLLDPRYTFDSFVVGASNQFAHASAVAVAEQPAKQYNPLFLYSPPGLGKTHLLHAIGNYALTHHKKARVAYLSAEKFVNELIDSLQHRRMPQFRSKYRDSYDMIFIDDIQFIAGKNTSEEEFFHTFNALHSSKRQIIVTSDRAPKEIQGLAERVRTRFEWGLVADISPPEIETRIAILKTKAERDDIYLPDDVATFLATHIKSNVRELEGLLIRLQAQSSLSGAEISLEMAKHELRSIVPEEGSIITIETIQQAVAKHFHLRVQDLKSTTRMHSIAFPRQIAMFLIRKYTSIGFKEIGQFFGGKDHTTILHACSKIESNLESDQEIREAVEAIQNLL